MPQGFDSLSHSIKSTECFHFNWNIGAGNCSNTLYMKIVVHGGKRQSVPFNVSSFIIHPLPSTVWIQMISHALFLFFVSRQHPRLCRVCLRHGGGGQHLHGALQGAEISRLHLDGVSWGEGSQAKVRLQFTNHAVCYTHTRSHTHAASFHSCASDALPHLAPPPSCNCIKRGGSLTADEAWDHFTDGCLIPQMHQPDQSPIYQQAN